jgi:Helix-hairpin-helix motif
MRKSHGAFKSVNDLMAIRGIGPKRLEKMRKYLTVGKAATPNTAQLANAKPKPRAPTKSAPTKSAPTKSVAAQVTKKTPPPQPSSAPSPEETEEP